ncbi:MAG: succinate dehydrogenase, hydrophobic membrane anchor protein [Gammaproteobacteria bacterium]|nr:MAG: succinate dehydrogenase, hydrophobic membrane anchor protein [Gammaproteobacteria bacterium]
MSREASGYRAWLIQRISAIYLALYTLYLVFYFVMEEPAGYQQWLDWLADPVVSTTMAIFFITLLFHAWIGIRDVVVDYIHPIAVRVSVLSLVVFYLIACGFWLIRTLIVVTFT